MDHNDNNNNILINVDGAYMVQQASKFLGVAEIPGDEDHPDIMEFFTSAGHSWVRSEKTPWCSAFMCHVAFLAGVKHPGSLRARNWLNLRYQDGWTVDKRCPPESLRYGDVLVLQRGHSISQAHVALFLGRRDKWLHCLGGNQNNKVCVKRYAESRLIGVCRRRVPT